MALVYYFGPNRKQTFRGVFPPGALASNHSVAGLHLGGGLVSSRYVANYNVLYGGVGAGLALLVWSYALAVIMLFGCEFNSIRERR